MKHDPNCTFCPLCSAEARALLSMSSAEKCAWIATQNAKHRAALHSEDNMKNDLDDYAAPDPYAADLAAMRAASSTPESRFENHFKAMRRNNIAVEDTEAASLRAAHEAHELPLTAADLAQYAPPDPYAEAIRALRQKESQR